ncbi:flagellar biosynthetic protein FliO [Nocardioides campestrisoli]|uniref:flagellar biosynthetic protein FliO n=1 Tax=Nocardioides campestrisoli TaxID=2736757 RepID=UPI0015E7B8C9|nr:flagellar biosynthetic protein FliO [Nocardioides campestrisoli]
MLELALRLVFSLAVVLGLLLLLARFGARRFKGGAGSLVQVVHRQPLTRGSSVAVVTVGSRVLVLGTTEQQVTLLTELDPEELLDDEAMAEGVLPVDPPAEAPRFAPETPPLSGHLGGPLSGSVLSRQTWRQALTALRRDRSGDRDDDPGVPGRHRP